MSCIDTTIKSTFAINIEFAFVCVNVCKFELSINLCQSLGLLSLSEKRMDIKLKPFIKHRLAFKLPGAWKDC